MNRRRFVAVLAAATAALAASAAWADPLTVARGQFTNRVEDRQPVGDAASIAGSRLATYWVEINNPSHEPSSVTLVWRVDGRERGRTQLTVGPVPVQRTWGVQPISRSRATQLEVRILDAQGRELHRDSTTITPPGAAAPAPAAPATP